MFTKKQFCQMVFQNQCETLRTTTPTFGDILKSGSLGIAMEHLGLLEAFPEPERSDAKEYLISRGGVLFFYFDNVDKKAYSLSMRELISLLPD